MSWQTLFSRTQFFSSTRNRAANPSRRLIVRTATMAGILMIALAAAPQARAQTQDTAASATTSNPIAEFFQKLAQPSRPAAEAPMDLQPQQQQEQQKIRYVKRSKKKKANPATADTTNASAAAAQTPASSPSIQSDWPNAAANAGMGDISPIVIKTVREMVEAELADEVVLPNELSDIDLAADPAPANSMALATTDGRAMADAGDTAHRPGPVASQIASVIENAKSLAQVSWIESILLVLTGALAAGTAMRFFA